MPSAIFPFCLVERYYHPKHFAVCQKEPVLVTHALHSTEGSFTTTSEILGTLNWLDLFPSVIDVITLKMFIWQASHKVQKFTADNLT